MKRNKVVEYQLKFYDIMNEHISANQKKLIISMAIIAIILTSYWNVQNYGFVHYDDPLYVTNNFGIQSGFTLKSITYAFTDFHTGHWLPLTMMSHMLDWQLFGDKAGGHHWTSVIIHILNTVLLFLLLDTLTGVIWRSAFVAVLFAIHPINVESVAWIAERKNVLSTFFWISTMLFYVWYVRSPHWKRYLPVLICFALGLMCKPMLITLPFVLLLLDYWPLKRTAINQRDEDRSEASTSPSVKKTKISFLILEKIPLLILTGISICLTFYAARSVNTVASLDFLPLAERINNAIVSYMLYIKKLFWPLDLAVFYPNIDKPSWQIFLSASLLLIITITVCRYFRKYPYLPVGWFWYIGTLVPVIGIVQVGAQAMADRYAYIPLIGLFIIAAWGMTDILKKYLSPKIIALTAGVVITTLLILTNFQVKYWENNITLFEHALKVTKFNFFAHIGLAGELLKQNKIEEAIKHYNTALILNPKIDLALINLGHAFSMQGENDKALAAFNQALKVNPQSAEAYNGIGYIFFKMKRFDEAIAAFRQALKFSPQSARTHNDIGCILLKMNFVAKAIEEYKKAIALNSNQPAFHDNLANALLRQRKIEEAVKEYNEVLQLQPANAITHYNLGKVLLQQDSMDEAAKHFQKALSLQPEYAGAHFYLAEILRRKGLFAEAAYHLKEAIRINPEYKDKDKVKIKNNIDN